MKNIQSCCQSIKYKPQLDIPCYQIGKDLKAPGVGIVLRNATSEHCFENVCCTAISENGLVVHMKS